MGVLVTNNAWGQLSIPVTAAATTLLLTGGQGDRYTIRMAGRETYLFFEHSADFGNPIPGRWFVERRECQP